jgi:hypothetical protein
MRNALLAGLMAATALDAAAATLTLKASDVQKDGGTC